MLTRRSTAGVLGLAATAAETFATRAVARATPATAGIDKESGATAAAVTGEKVQ